MCRSTITDIQMCQCTDLMLLVTTVPSHVTPNNLTKIWEQLLGMNVTSNIVFQVTLTRLCKLPIALVLVVILQYLFK